MADERLRVVIEGTSADLMAALRQAGRGVQQFDRTVDRSSRNVAAHNQHTARAAAGYRNLGRASTGLNRVLGVNTGALLRNAAAFASVAAAAKIMRDSVNETLALAKATTQLKRTTGLDTQEASAWVAVAKARGVEATKLNRSFIMLEKQLTASRQGSEKSTAALKALGLTQRDIEKGSFHQVIRKVADGYKDLKDPIERAAVAQQLFGRGGVSILPMLTQGSKGIAEYQRLAKELGATLSNDGLKNTLALRDAQIKWNLSMQGLKNTLAQGLMPALAKGALAVTGFLREMRTGTGEGGKFAAKMRDLWNSLKPVFLTLGQVAKAVAAFVGKHPALVKVVATFVALGLAVKAISFVGSLTGVTKLIGLVARLGKLAVVGARGGVTLAEGIASGFTPAWNARTGGIRTKIRTALGRIGTSAGETAGSNAAGTIAGTLGAQLPSKLRAQGIGAKIGAIGKAAGKTFAGLLIAGAVAGLAALAGALEKAIAKAVADALSYQGDINRPDPLDPRQKIKDFFNSLIPGRSGGILGTDGFRRYAAGGLVPSVLSPGELVVPPSGGAFHVPGAPVAADTVPMLLPAGTGVVTGHGQQLLAGGASLREAIAHQAPHFASGGWVRTGATLDDTKGQDPPYSSHGGMSFAELLVAGPNRGIGTPAGKILGIPSRGWVGMPMGTTIRVRKPGNSKSYRIWKNDNGSGDAAGNPHYTIDLHGKIARLLGISKGDIEMARDDGGATTTNTPGGTDGQWVNTTEQRSRLVVPRVRLDTRENLMAGTWRRAAMDAGWSRERGPGLGLFFNRGGGDTDLNTQLLASLGIDTSLLPHRESYTVKGRRWQPGGGGMGTMNVWERFAWPTTNHTITSGFGPRSAPTRGASSYHDGVDIGVGTGTSVRASLSGKVDMAGSNGGYGNYVGISHPLSGLYSFYGHLSKIQAHAGATIRQGAQLGLSGSTGVSTGPHLHWGLHDHGAKKDPRGYVGKRFKVGTARTRRRPAAAAGRGGNAAIAWAEQFVGMSEGARALYAITSRAPGEWCGAFAEAAARQGGAQASDWLATSSIIAHAKQHSHGLRGWGPLSSGSRGDLALFDWNHNGSPNHVGLIRQVLGPSKVATVEGNTSGGRVLNKIRSGSEIMGAARVAYRRGGIVQRFAGGGIAGQPPRTGGIRAPGGVTRGAGRSPEWRRTDAANRKARAFTQGRGRLRDYIDLIWNTPPTLTTTQFTVDTTRSFEKALMGQGKAKSDGALRAASSYIDSKIREVGRHAGKDGKVTGGWKIRQNRMMTLQTAVLNAIGNRLYGPSDAAGADLDLIDTDRSRAETGWKLGGVWDTLPDGSANPDWDMREAVWRKAWEGRLAGSLAALQAMIPRALRFKDGDVYAGKLTEQAAAVKDRLDALLVEDADQARQPAASSSAGSELADLNAQILAAQQESNRISSQLLGVFTGFAPLVGQRLVGSFAHGGFVGETGMALVHRGEQIIPDPGGPFANTTAAAGGKPPQVVVHVHGDAAPLMKQIQVEVDGKIQRAQMRQGRRARVLGGVA